MLKFTDLLQQKVEVFEEAERIDRGRNPEYKAKIADEVSSMVQFSTNDDQNSKLDLKGIAASLVSTYYALFN